MTFSKKGFQTISILKLFGNFHQIHIFHEHEDITEELKGTDTPNEKTIIKMSHLPTLKRGCRKTKGPEGDVSWGLRGHAGSQEPDAAVKGGVKTTFQCEAELRVWRNNGGRFLLESKPAASCDSGRAKQADGTVGFTWTLWGGGGGSLLIRCPITVAKQNRAKTMWDPEVMMATHLRKPRPPSTTFPPTAETLL